MRHRLAILICCLGVLLAPAVAPAQDGNPFDAQLPPAQPTPAPTVEPIDNPNDDAFGRETLWLIGGGIAIAMLAFGFWITRDARSSLPRGDGRTEQRQRDQGPHKHERQAKAKARAKGRAQRQARKASRKGKARR